MATRQTNRELWTKIFTDLEIDPEQNVSYVTAEQVRRISQREARNMAYMDERAKVPPIFDSHSLFILPVSNGRYAIVRGQGYHSLELDSIVYEDFHQSFPLGIACWTPRRARDQQSPTPGTLG